MLHIDDIREKLEQNPEPDFVKEVRENIISSFSNLQFLEEGHKYFVHKADGSTISLPSVSHVCHQFQPFVDWDEIAQRKATKEGIPKEELQRQWKENNIRSTNNGTITHEFGEGYMYFFQGKPELIPDRVKIQYEDGFFIPYGKKQEAICRFYEDLYKIDNFYPVMPEARIYTGLEGKGYDFTQNYSGTFDMLFACQIRGKWKLALLDWKGLPLDTPILTVEGFKKMGDLTTDDIVFDRDGKPTKILHCSEVHHNPCMRMTFDDNFSIVSDIDHRWVIHFKKDNGDFEEKVMTTKELYDYVAEINAKGRHGKNIPKIMLNKPIDIDTLNVGIDPYVLGVWLGDGSTHSGYITNMYPQIFQEISRRGYEIGNNVDKTNHVGKAETRCILGLSTQLRKLGILDEKDIPDNLLLTSYNFKWEILCGLMDSDGYYNKKRNRYVMSTTRLAQAQYTMRLLASLGIKGTLMKAKGRCSNCKHTTQFDKYDVAFYTERSPFLMRTVQPSRQQGSIKYTFRNIMKIEEVEMVPTRCIEVDSPSHTYLATERLLVTHNTNKSLENPFNKMSGNTLLNPFSYMIDEPKSIYTIQLSLYQLGLEQLGYEIADRKIIWLKEDGNYEKISVPDVTKELINVLK